MQAKPRVVFNYIPKGHQQRGREGGRGCCSPVVSSHSDHTHPHPTTPKHLQNQLATQTPPGPNQGWTAGNALRNNRPHALPYNKHDSRATSNGARSNHTVCRLFHICPNYAGVPHVHFCLSLPANASKCNPGGCNFIFRGGLFSSPPQMRWGYQCLAIYYKVHICCEKRSGLA